MKDLELLKYKTRRHIEENQNPINLNMQEKIERK